MTINQRIYQYAADTAAAHQIKDVRIGLGYTAVMTENGRTGLAATPKTHLHQGCTVFTGMLPLIDKNADQLLALINSDDPIETAVGLATANALVNIPNADLDTTGDVLTKIRVKSSDRVAMVGHFAPLVKPIRDTGAELNIFEQIAVPHREMRPSSEIPKKLPECTVCFLTATSIINHSFDELIGHARNCREAILLGASTPLVADIFADTPVTGLSGVIVTRPEALLHIVSAGGGARRFKGVVEKVNRPVNQTAQNSAEKGNKSFVPPNSNLA